MTPPNNAGVTCVWVAVDQFIVEALMVALAMIVGHELAERATDMPSPSGITRFRSADPLLQVPTTGAGKDVTTQQ